MWISNKERRTHTEEATAQLGAVTVQSGSPAVFLSGERRDVTTTLPGGYHWRPKQGDAVLVVKSGEEGAASIVGTKQTAPAILAPGEVFLSINGTSGVHLKADGTVHLQGEIYVNGIPLSHLTQEVEK